MDLDALIERLSAGEVIDPQRIPPALRQREDVQRLLALARVLERIAVNAAESTPEPPQASTAQRLGPFRLLRLIGAGGMGEVWLGLRDDGQAEQRVAIKRVRGGLPGFAARLRSERRILARLEHPNIARFIDAGVDDTGSPWLALEYVDGVPVTDWCSGQNLPLAERLQLFCKICAAVDDAHRHLIVHRDLKPANVLVDGRGEPKLLDFGVAQLLDDTQAEATSGSLTPSYAAPEQLRGQPLGTAADIYALGLLLFRLLAGQLPPGRRGKPLAAILEQLASEEDCRPSSEALPELPYARSALHGDLDAIVGKALRAEPAQRYRSAAELAEDIQRHLQTRPVRARPLTPAYRLGRFLRRNRTAAAFAALAVGALLLGSVLAIEQARRANAAAALAAQEAQAARKALARAAQVSAFLESLFREQDPFARSGARARSAEALLAEGVARVEAELTDDPEGRLRLLLSLAEAQLGQGLGAEAKTTLGLARNLLGALGRPAEPAIRLAVLQAEVDEAGLRLPEALEQIAEAERLATAWHGAESIERARILRLKARLLVTSGRMDEALEAADWAHQRLLAEFGPEAVDTAIARYQLGVVREQRREDAAALADFEAVVAAIEVARGPEHALLVRPLMSLGEVQRRMRRFEAGRATLRRGAAIAEAGLGPRHVQHAAILIRLGTLERDAGDHRAALLALDAAERALPEGELATLAQLHASRGAIHISLDDPAAAEPELRRAMELRHGASGNSGLAWYSQAEWASAVARLGRHDEALAALREARQELAALLGPQAYQNSLIAARLGAALMLAGQPQAAAEELAEAERLVIASAGPANLNALQYRLQRAEALAALPERQDEARALITSLRSAASASADTRAALEAKGLAALEARLARPH